MAWDSTISDLKASNWSLIAHCVPVQQTKTIHFCPIRSAGDRISVPAVISHQTAAASALLRSLFLTLVPEYTEMKTMPRGERGGGVLIT